MKSIKGIHWDIFSLLFFAHLSLITFGQTNTITLLTDVGTKYDYAHSIAIQSDGRVLIAGDAYGNPCMIRFDTTGRLDQSFGVNGIVIESWTCGTNPADNDIKIQADGKILSGTRFYNGNDDDFIVARYIDDGSRDVTFGDNGKVITQLGAYNDWCNCIAIQADGKILAGGGSNNSPQSDYNYDFALVRYDIDGALDFTFGNEGIASTHIGISSSIAYSIAIQQDGKIILAGETTDSIFSDLALARYNPDGSLDNTFGNDGIVRTTLSPTYDRARSVVLQADEKILVAGSSQNSLSNYNFALARYNSDGTLDESFGNNGISLTDIGSDFGNSIALQADGKIILAGSTAAGTIYSFATLRYHTDGSLDDSFGSDGLITTSFGPRSSGGKAVALGKDGEILVAGTYNHGSSKYFDFALLRLFSSLSPQTTPTLLFPPDEATEVETEAELIWSPITGVSEYILEVCDIPGFDQLIINQAGLTSAGSVATGLKENTKYYWRVGANFEGTVYWSDTWHFTTLEDLTNIPKAYSEQIRMLTLASGKILRIEGIGHEPVTVSFISIDGKMIKQIKEFDENEIDIHGIQKGIYIIRIYNSEINYAEKIII